MKVVIDTNVILSSLITQGMAHRVVEKCLEDHDLFISDWVIREVAEKLTEKFKVKKSDVKETVRFIKSTFVLIKPEGKLPTKCKDKDDNNLLLLAGSIDADVMITGDKDLLVIKKYKSTIILTPRDFYQQF